MAAFQAYGLRVVPVLTLEKVGALNGEDKVGLVCEASDGARALSSGISLGNYGNYRAIIEAPIFAVSTACIWGMKGSCRTVERVRAFDMFGPWLA